MTVPFEGQRPFAIEFNITAAYANQVANGLLAKDYQTARQVAPAPAAIRVVVEDKVRSFVRHTNSLGEMQWISLDDAAVVVSGVPFYTPVLTAIAIRLALGTRADVWLRFAGTMPPMRAPEGTGLLGQQSLRL